MSEVSGVVLTVSVCETMADGPCSGVLAVNEWLIAKGHDPLNDVTQHAIGRMHPQIDVYASGFNYLDEDAFIAAVRAAPWVYPGNVALIVNPEEGATRVFRLEG